MKTVKRFLLTGLVGIILIVGCSVGTLAADDSVKEYPLNVCYDTETGRIYNKNGKGFLFGFDYDKDDNFWYTPVNAWQRSFGYSKVYDDLAFIAGCFYDTVRVYFEYDGKEWLVQYWKGIYGYTSGAEIGIYNRPTGTKGSFYKCISDDELPEMTLLIKRNGETFISQPTQKHWWMTGFVLPSRVSADKLDCEMSIDMKNKEFAKLLVKGLEENGFKNGESIKKSGTRVTLIW